MSELWQVDIFRYMTDCLEIPQNEISGVIASLVPGTSNDPTKINKLLRGTLFKGYEGLQAGRVYEELIAPALKRMELDPARALCGLKKFLDEQAIAFGESDGLADCDYKTYMCAVLKEGLPKFKRPKAKAASPKTDPGQQNSVPVPAAAQPGPVLHPQNFISLDSFTGREDTLEQMAELLRTKRTAVLSGLGGIGKTSLTNEYAQRHAGEYQQRQRIVCGNTVRSFRQMILALNFDGLDEAEIEEDAKYQERMKQLKKMDSSTLLILDNIDDWPDDFGVFSELRRDSQIHIIITTRLRGKFDQAYMIQVDALEKADQLKLFEYHLNCKVEDKSREIVTEILECVNGHTFLIELIAKSIDSGSLDYSDMLEILRSGETSAELPDISIDIQKDDYNKQDRMWHFIQKVLFNIQPLTQEQQDTLRNLALLPVDGISRRLFLRNLSPQATDTLTYLESRSWSVRDRADSRDVIKLHPVIRDSVKAELSPTCGNCRVFLDKLEQLLATDDAAGYPEDLCKLIQSTASTLAPDFMDNPCAENADFLVRAVEFYRKWKEYDYRNALSIYELGHQTLQSMKSRGLCPYPEAVVVDLYMGAGWCCQQLADYKKAIRYYNTAANAAPEGSQQQAKAYRCLGEVYRKDSNYPKALEFDQLALKLFTEDFDIAEVQNAIGVVYINMGDIEKAQKFYLAARERWEICLAAQPSDALYQKLAYVNHNIGTTYYKMGQYPSAVEQHEKALEIRMEHKFPECQRDIASSHAWLANDYLALGKECREQGESPSAERYMEESRKHVDESLSIRKELLGEKHPDYAWSLNTLSCWYEANGDISSALSTMEKVIQIRRSALSDGHQYTENAVKRYETLQLKLQKGS